MFTKNRVKTFMQVKVLPQSQPKNHIKRKLTFINNPARMFLKLRKRNSTTVKKSHIVYIFCAVCILFFYSNSQATQPDYFQPQQLRIELLKGKHVKNIRDPSPEFSWTLTSTQPLTQQTAYQIQLYYADNPNLKDPVWDSQKQLSSKTLAVTYQGQTLQPNVTYTWRVKTWAQNKKQHILESAWSELQTFTTHNILDNGVSQHDTTTTIIAPQSIKQLASGNYLVDFKKVAFGYAELKLTSEQSGTIDITLAERANELGAQPPKHKGSSVRFYKMPLHINENTDHYRIHPPRDKRNTRLNKAIGIPGRFGRIAPFRYIEIDPKGLNLSDIQVSQIALHYPFDNYASYFKSDNSTLNAIWELSKYSMKATSFAGLYVDGDRERIPYEADAYINQLSHYSVDNEYSLARASVNYLIDHPTWPTEWKQHSIMIAWTDWMYTGDKTLLAQTFQKLKNTKTFEQFTNKHGLLESFPDKKHTIFGHKTRDIVDWPPNERDGFEFKKINTVVNAFHYANLRQMADIALALDKHNASEIYKKRAKTLFSAFNRSFFNEKTGLYIDGLGSNHSSAHANILPLALGLIPQERKASVLAFLEKKGMAVSVYFAQYLMEALYKNEPALAFSLLTSKQKRSWYNMIRVGSTITLEAWDDSIKPNQDWNHAWGAAPANIISRYILGIKPMLPGFEKAHIAPNLHGLKNVEAHIPTIKGTIVMTTSMSDQHKTTLHITIPNTMQAHISFPFMQDKKVRSVLINQKPVTFTQSPFRLSKNIFGAGTYRFDINH